MDMPVRGTFAAVLTPRLENERLKEERFRAWLSFLMQRGIQGFAVNGATGEFCRTTYTEFDRLVAVTAEMTSKRGSFIASVGSATSQGAIKLGKAALRRGARGLLLPVPYFFPYSQGDVTSFCRSVAAAIDAPILLYNLPQFTTQLEPETSLQLIRECDSIIGIKDSSGSLETLGLLTCEGVEACRVVGNDQILDRALQLGVCDGVVSGVACVLPELMQEIYACGRRTRQEGKRNGMTGDRSYARLTGILDKLLEHMNPFPVPWALKILGECRGLGEPAFPFPLSAERQRQKEAFAAWFQDHAGEMMAEPLTPHMLVRKGAST